MLTQLAICMRIAHRARLTLFVGGLAILMLVACLLAAQFSGRQPATVALDVGLSVIRLLLPVFVVLLLQELFFREFDKKYHFLSLTYPRSRFSFMASRSLAVLSLTIAALLLLAVALWSVVRFIGQGYAAALPPHLGLPYWITIAFIAADLVVAVAVGTLLSVGATSFGFILAGTLGFLLCARSFAPVIDLLTRDSTLVPHAATYQSSLHYLGYILPDLSALDVRLISLYSNMAFLPADWPYPLLSAGAYALAAFGLAVWIFGRRKFS